MKLRVLLIWLAIAAAAIVATNAAFAAVGELQGSRLPRSELPSQRAPRSEVPPTKQAESPPISTRPGDVIPERPLERPRSGEQRE
jgi:hypothetical protein